MLRCALPVNAVADAPKIMQIGYQKSGFLLLGEERARTGKGPRASRETESGKPHLRGEIMAMTPYRLF
jgi:hypothetical protein